MFWDSFGNGFRPLYDPAKPGKEKSNVIFLIRRLSLRSRMNNSYFSGNFKLKIFLRIFLDYNT